jgi:Family of unknown function (DUF5302)
MTKSAKQDSTAGQAKTAVAESAATADADATDPADATPADATPADATPAAADGGTDSDAATAEPGKPDLDDVKAKFREALDRKRQVHAEGQGKGGHESGKVNGAHGPAASRRNFRRKSG